jgi:hypothetical protein
MRWLGIVGSLVLTPISLGACLTLLCLTTNVKDLAQKPQAMVAFLGHILEAQKAQQHGPRRGMFSR